MNNSLLLENETILNKTEDDGVILTNYRIRQNFGTQKHPQFISIHLKKISSVELYYKETVLWLILGIVLLAFGLITFLSYRVEPGAIGIVLGGLFLLLYYLSKRYLMRICSDGGSHIAIQIKGIKADRIQNFVMQLEQAKNNLHLLKKY